jgi:hypothetical protein
VLGFAMRLMLRTVEEEELLDEKFKVIYIYIIYVF